MKTKSTQRYQPTRNYKGGGLMGYVTCSYVELVALFGKPNADGDDKVIFSWTVEDTVTGNVFELYDYRECLSPSMLRKLPTYQWHIGGTKLDLEAFGRFMNEKLGRDADVRNMAWR